MIRVLLTVSDIVADPRPGLPPSSCLSLLAKLFRQPQLASSCFWGSLNRQDSEMGVTEATKRHIRQVDFLSSVPQKSSCNADGMTVTQACASHTPGTGWSRSTPHLPLHPQPPAPHPSQRRRPTLAEVALRKRQRDQEEEASPRNPYPKRYGWLQHLCAVALRKLLRKCRTG